MNDAPLLAHTNGRDEVMTGGRDPMSSRQVNPKRSITNTAGGLQASYSEGMETYRGGAVVSAARPNASELTSDPGGRLGAGFSQLRQRLSGKVSLPVATCWREPADVRLGRAY